MSAPSPDSPDSSLVSGSGGRSAYFSIWPTGTKSADYLSDRPLSSFLRSGVSLLPTPRAMERRSVAARAVDVRNYIRLMGEVEVYQADFNRFVDEYYRSGSPDQAADAIWFFVNSEMLGKCSSEGGIDLTPYAFARIAEDHPEVIRNYEALLDKAPPRGKAYILSLLGMVGDEGTQGFLKNRLWKKALKSGLNMKIKQNGLIWKE